MTSVSHSILAISIAYRKVKKVLETATNYLLGVAASSRKRWGGFLYPTWSLKAFW